MKITSLKRFFYKDNIEESLFYTLLIFLKIKILKKSNSKEIEKRKNLSIFDFENLSTPIEYYPHFLIYENNLYGNGRNLFELLKYSFISKVFTRIEHATPYAFHYIPNIYNLGFCKRIIVQSEERKNILKNHIDKNITSIGTYIQKINGLVSISKKFQLKEKLGKTLLVFPSHSIEGVESNYDTYDFVRFIKSFEKKGFKTIIVCLYWKDIQLGRHHLYEKNGFKIATAGHIYDYYFINRLKSLIELSDFTISNSIGTHIGYCISLGKGHQIYSSNVTYSLSEKQKLKNRMDIFDSKNSIKEIEKYFKKEKNYIGSDQLCCANKYWGVNLNC